MAGLFAVICRDVEGSAAIRGAARAAHFANIETIADRLKLAGPLYAADGTINGSLVILTAADEADARAVAEADPYFAAGVWADIRVQPFLAAAGEWVGGKTW